ncbi:sensor histidine kinase [Microbacterium fluvii]|uniref:histidine kinase n=1 Tax=Microbacterium fluvii TaxID=415215 RepID=A0ABW2H832_9MICO|nr:PAS domain-containing sensor histidine kinase [Microbacterium fluvii]MCU4671148.1 PAS domain-containing sensor histidine kinase [Microbacterium fluvii]
MGVGTGTQATPADTRRWGDGRSRSIWQWQLILAVSVVALVVSVALLVPSVLQLPQFIAGAVAIVAITCAVLATPWHRASKRTVVFVPLLDIVAIGMLASGTEGRMSSLWVFPIAWIATYYSLPWLIGGLSVVAAVLVVDTLAAGLTPIYMLRMIVVLLCLGFLGVTIHIGARRTRAFSGLLRRQFTQLSRAFRRVELQDQRSMILFNSLDTGLARVDRRGSIRGANDAYRRLYSIDDVAQPHPTGAVEYGAYRGSALPAGETTMARAVRGEVFETRVWLFDTDGHWHALDVATRAVAAGLGEGETTLLTVRDVTAALDAERDRKTMTSIVSHELRNPLTAIVGHVDLLLDRDDLPADVVDKLTVVENAGQRMQQLIASALETDKQVAPVDEAVDFRRVITASVDAFLPAAEAAQVTLEADLGRDLLVGGDAFRLRQVVDNLVGNAVKYTPRGGHVSVDAQHVGDKVRILIDDSGIGISRDDLPHVFDRYFRAKTARDSGISGTGLGMAIAREIVEQHGGRLEIDSTLGQGTTATVLLPARSEGTPTA